MLRGLLILLAILGGITLSFADSRNSDLLKEERWNQARKLLVEGKAVEARAGFEELLTKYPNEADLHVLLAISLLRLRDPDAAEGAIRKAIVVDPKHAEARTLLGWMESEIRGNFEAATREYTKVIELRPDSAEAYNNLGTALKRKGELSKALDSFNQALERRADYSAALSNRGWVFAEQHRWSEARRDFEQALKVSPGDEGALYGLAQVLREGRDYAGAQAALGRLIAQSPNFVYWLEWSRVGLIRYYWVFLLITLAFFLKARFKKARNETHGS